MILSLRGFHENLGGFLFFLFFSPQILSGGRHATFYSTRDESRYAYTTNTLQERRACYEAYQNFHFVIIFYTLNRVQPWINYIALRRGRQLTAV